MVRALRPTRRRDPGGFVHLAENKAGVLDNARLLHFEPEVVPLAGSLTHTGESGVTAVLGGH